MKVALPAGASIVSVEVGGAPAAPVEGTDGSRVPLLRPGLRTDGLYAVSFAYLHEGTPFLKKGGMQMALPPLDIPVNVVEWELFVPDAIRADRFDGNVVGAGLIGFGGGQELSPLAPAMPGQIAGRVLDQSGAPLPGATVTIENGGRKQQIFTATDGSYVASNLAPGDVTVSGDLQGFRNARRVVQQTGEQVDLTLDLAGVAETVTVAAQTPNAPNTVVIRNDEPRRHAKAVENEAPSVNVQNLQRRAAGVLPIRMDVPRAGSSHRFVRPLVIDEPTIVTFRYKRR
jgi:hypothetical protein